MSPYNDLMRFYENPPYNFAYQKFPLEMVLNPVVKPQLDKPQPAVTSPLLERKFIVLGNVSKQYPLDKYDFMWKGETYKVCKGIVISKLNKNAEGEFETTRIFMVFNVTTQKMLCLSKKIFQNMTREDFKAEIFFGKISQNSVYTSILLINSGHLQPSDFKVFPRDKIKEIEQDYTVNTKDSFDEIFKDIHKMASVQLIVFALLKNYIGSDELCKYFEYKYSKELSSAIRVDLTAINQKILDAINQEVKAMK